MQTRERRLARTFVELADSLVDDFDVVDLMSLLTERSVELLDSTAAGLVLAESAGGLRLIAATSEAIETVELFEIQSDEGPCRDCIHGGTPVSSPDLTADADTWPRFVGVATRAGFRAAHALPLRLRGQMLGALNLFRHEPGALSRDELVTAQALADVATIALLQNRALRDSQLVADQLEHALSSRVTIEQAKGIVGERLRCSMDEAFVRIRRHARSNGLLLADVAGEIVAGRLDARTI